MPAKNSNTYGLMAVLAALLLLFALFRRRFRWGLLLLNLLLAAGEKWRENREMDRIHSLTNQID